MLCDCLVTLGCHSVRSGRQAHLSHCSCNSEDKRVRPIVAAARSERNYTVGNALNLSVTWPLAEHYNIEQSLKVPCLL